MRTKIIVIFVLAIVGAGAVWILSHRHDGFDRKNNVLPPETRKVLDSGQRFVLLSLSPMRRHPAPGEESDPSPKETFHDYPVLGKTEIRDEKERAELLRALYKGVADSDGLAYECFNPRHGITATLGDETVDLLICFECLSILSFQTHAKDGKSVLTTRSPEPTFNRSLEKAKLPIAK